MTTVDENVNYINKAKHLMAELSWEMTEHEFNCLVDLLKDVREEAESELYDMQIKYRSMRTTWNNAWNKACDDAEEQRCIALKRKDEIDKLKIERDSWQHACTQMRSHEHINDCPECTAAYNAALDKDYDVLKEVMEIVYEISSNTSWPPSYRSGFEVWSYWNKRFSNAIKSMKQERS